MSKQGVIEVFRELAIWDIQAEGYPNLEDCYDRIAPLMVGEFPEEEAIREVNDLIHSIEGYIDGGDAQSVCEAHIYTLILQTFKHLWEGRDHIAGLRKKVWKFPEDKTLEVTRGFCNCPRCRGLREKRHQEGQPEGDNPTEQDKPVHDLEGGLWVLTSATTDTANVHFPPAVDATRPTEGDNILEQIEEEVDDIILEQDKPKGTCQTCGGSEKVPDHDKPIGDDCRSILITEVGTYPGKDCPDCTREEKRTKGERRGERRNQAYIEIPELNVKRMVAYQTHELGEARPKPTFTPDRRTLPTRRKAGSG